MPTVIHVNRHRIVSNRKTGEREPCIAVRKTRSGKADYVNRAELVDEQGRVVARFVYSPDKPLQCGAVVYVEVEPHLQVRPG